MIKKAKRIPEEVEYFVWEGWEDDLPDLSRYTTMKYMVSERDLLFLHRSGNVAIRVTPGMVVVFEEGKGVMSYVPETFSALFVPLPEETK